MNPRRPLPMILALALLAIAPAICAQTPVAPEPIAYGEGKLVCNLAEPLIDESSGLAASRRHADIFWSHNDSGDLPRLYAFDRQGKIRAKVDLLRGSSLDWEDMASCRIDGRDCLLVADVGDNQQVRPHVDLYLVTEPDLDAGQVALQRQVRFRYADGSHNCEAVAFDPIDRQVLLITKTFDPPCRIFTLPWPAEPPREPQVARAVGSLPHRLVTAMDISPNGRRAVVSTYGPAYQWQRREGEDWASALARPGQQIALPMRRQGESVCYGADGKTLYLTSEKLPTPLWEVPPIP